MKILLATAAAIIFAAASAAAQQPAPAPSLSFQAGKPLGVIADGKYAPMSSNAKVYGGIVSAESCSYDSSRDLIMVVNRGAAQNEAPNDGFVSLLNHDGSVHTAKWIGVNRNGLVLNHPFGSAIHAGKLYLADLDGGTADGTPPVGVLRMFDLATGAPAGEIKVAESDWLNDLAVDAQGIVYATQTGSADGKRPFRVYRIAPDGTVGVLIEGAPLSLPNGIEIDGQGNLVVVNMGSTAILTFSRDGKLLKTEQAAQSGNDGLVIMADGTKYVSSVRFGGVQRIRPGRPAELIATGIPSAASMCYDPKANRLVIPMNPNNAVAFVEP